MNKIKIINIARKFSLFDEKWTPKIVAELNQQHVKLCKLQNNFVWHTHDHEDELFMIIKGTLYIDIKNNETITLNAGELVVIPKGTEHRPRTNGKVVLCLLFEPKSTLHFGDKEDVLTSKKIDWI